MKIEQIYTGCLAQGAYYIISNGEAAIIDPLRETAPYIHRLEKDGAKLKYIFETHFHADFVSGHIDLARKTGAPIIYGPNATPEFDAIIATDGQIFQLGEVYIKAIHTPGHTMESTCYLLIDELNEEKVLFSGDTLFLGDVGRPDLAQKSANISQEELAGLLYDSLYEKIMPLNDSVIVYPAHGAGSACGKNMMKETSDTLAHQKKVNYALRQPNKETFIKAVTDGLLPPPAYFGINVALNKKGYNDFDHVLQESLKKLNPDQFEQLANDSGALILDTRNNSDFAKAFIPNAINIGLNGDFAPWVGALVVDIKHPILLVTDEGKEEETVTRLSRVGFDGVIGFLEGGFNSWLKSGKEVDHVSQISAEKMQEYSIKDQHIIDVRKESEFDADHLANATNKPLSYINDWINEIDNSKHFFIHCAGGYRSMIASSILLSRGKRNFTEISGGFNALKKTDIAKTEFASQNKS